MPNLLIKCVYGTQWRAYASNSTVEYTFQGVDVEAQNVSVKILSDAMQQGEGAVVQGVQDIFQNVAVGEEQAVVDQLFGATTQLYREGELVFSAADTLLADIEEAGEALALVV